MLAMAWWGAHASSEARRFTWVGAAAATAAEAAVGKAGSLQQRCMHATHALSNPVCNISRLGPCLPCPALQVLRQLHRLQQRRPLHVLRRGL